MLIGLNMKLKNLKKKSPNMTLLRQVGVKIGSEPTKVRVKVGVLIQSPTKLVSELDLGDSDFDWVNAHPTGNICM